MGDSPSGAGTAYPAYPGTLSRDPVPPPLGLPDQVVIGRPGPSRMAIPRVLGIAIPGPRVPG